MAGLGYFFVSFPKASLISPVLGQNKLKIADNIWFPKEASISAKNKNIEDEITSKAAFFVDTETGEVLFEKNSKEKLSIASLVKIMSVIVTLENRSLDDLLNVSVQASEMEPDKMYLKAGERLTVKELLEGIFLVSGNDAAEVLAEETTGRREEFLNLMNSKARQLGMSNTNFINPTGLEEDPSTCSGQVVCQWSTAYDVSLMSRYAISKWPNLLDISSQPVIYIEETETHQEYGLNNGINLLTTYPGVLGFKTGYTPEAGLTLVTVARRDGHQVLGVLLGATNRRDDAKILLDYSFAKLGVEVD